MINLDSFKKIESYSAIVGIVVLYAYFKKQMPKIRFWNFVNNTGIRLLYLYGFLLFLGL